MGDLGVKEPRKKIHPAIIIAIVIFGFIVAAVINFVLVPFVVHVIQNEDVTLPDPPGWNRVRRDFIKDEEDSLERRGYKQDVNLSWTSPDNQGGISITDYRPSSTDVFYDLPDTESIEEMEEFIKANETQLQEYIKERYSTTAEMKTLKTDSGQVVLALTLGRLELVLVKRSGKVFTIYINGKEMEAFVVENLKVE